MGYKTIFSLTTEDGRQTQHMACINEEFNHGYELFDDDMKWYSHENDMKAYSLQHSTTLFELGGKGEENGDIWKKYFKNGKVQVCKAKITFDAYDEDKLA